MASPATLVGPIMCDGEASRTYAFNGKTATISNPAQFYYVPGAGLHWVHAAGVTTVVPAPGYNGCVLTITFSDGQVHINHG